MKVVVVSNVLGITQISKSNNSAWEKLMHIMDNETEGVLFDFKEVNIEEPWNNELFKKFFSNPLVYMKVYSSERLKNTIDIACHIGNMKPGRVINEDEVVIVPSVKNKVVEKFKDMFKNSIEVVGDTGVLNICCIVDQLCSIDTVKGLDGAITEFSKDNGIFKFKLVTEYLFIQINILEELANLVVKMRSKGINLIVQSNDEDVEQKIKIHICLAGAKSMSNVEKLNIFNSTIEPLTVGILTKYSYTRRVDVFGRRGDGKPLYCRVAIFNGINTKDMTVCFTEFDGEYFHTKMHMLLDKEIKDARLVYRRLIIPIQQIGLNNNYVGSLYHFNYPLQCKLEDGINTYKLCNEKIVSTRVTIPEYIKMVLDDHGVKHNSVKLIDCIGETLNILKNKSKN